MMQSDESNVSISKRFLYGRGEIKAEFVISKGNFMSFTLQGGE
jgi:hypothetical protein